MRRISLPLLAIAAVGALILRGNSRILDAQPLPSRGSVSVSPPTRGAAGALPDRPNQAEWVPRPERRYKGPLFPGGSAVAAINRRGLRQSTCSAAGRPRESYPGLGLRGQAVPHCGHGRRLLASCAATRRDSRRLRRRSGHKSATISASADHPTYCGRGSVVLE
jgi:hypothetical protein